MDDKVMVGDYLGTIEEFMPGEGTYSEDGKIFAAKIGVKHVDPQKHTAQVVGKSIPNLKVGQTVFGEVAAIKNNNVVVIVGKIQGVKGYVDERTTIYVSNIDDKYVDKPEDLFAVGDIVKAKIIKMDSNMIDISTKGENGVVKAFCKRCRGSMEKVPDARDKLKCSLCRHVEKRKVSMEYANVSQV